MTATDNGCQLQRIYLDYNATAPLLPEALEAAMPYYTSMWGNASSIHRQGREARMAVENARAQVAQLIGAASPLDLVFTSGGTEAINLAIRGYVWGNRTRGHHIITTETEHPAVLDTCRALEQEGYELTYLPVDRLGRVHPEALAQSIGPHTILCTLTYGNHEVGTLQPVEALVDVAHAHGVIVHVDAVQAVGRVPVDVMGAGIDLLSLSGHKFGGPKGVGVLYIREPLGTTMQPVICGGHQERQRRAGTEDVPSIVALGRACALIAQSLGDEEARLRRLRDHLEAGVQSRIGAVHALGRGGERLPNTANLSFTGVKGEALVFNLDLLGVAVSTGASCSSRQGVPSQVLEVMGVTREVSEGSVRFSLGWSTTDADIERVLEVLPSTVERLRLLSPLA